MDKQKKEALRDEQLQQVAGGGADSMFAGLDMWQLIEGPLAAAEEAKQKLAAATEEFIESVGQSGEQGHRKVETRTFSFCSGGSTRKE